MTGVATVFIGLGSNLGDSGRIIAQALDELDRLPKTAVAAASHLYRCAPWGVTDQPDFVNAAAMLSTELSPAELLQALLAIERAHGRDRAAELRWGPRVLDLDVLLYDDRVIDEPGLTVPHSRMHQRAFVLAPLLEIAPQAQIPGIGPARDCLDKLDVRDAVRLPAGAGRSFIPRRERNRPQPTGNRSMPMSHQDIEQLAAHAQRTQLRPLSALIANDPARAHDFALRVGPLYANFARQLYDREALDALFALAERADTATAMRRLLDGEEVNATERRAALHTALRSDLSTADTARRAHAQALEARTRMAGMVRGLADSHITDIVSVGIGGSDLGPRLVVDALAQSDARFRVHFISNVDGAAAQRTLSRLDPANTAAVLISKTFGTQETLLNGALVREWLGNDTRLYAVSANTARAEAFGVAGERVLPMWDWVGGRYSLWSAVGFPIALGIGWEHYESLLAGAARMDAHVLQAPARQNLPLWHALTAVWNRNALHAATQAVLPYDERLRLLPSYLQQLVMESLGKSVRLDGQSLPMHSVPVWWGGAGTDAQHSFFQALHQGTQAAPADFIGVVVPDHPHADNHAALLANLLAQTEAFANGQASDDPHRQYPGNRPSTLLLLDALTAESLGMLIALYEHSVYLQSVLWGINAFDQFGVELGKQLAGVLLPALHGQSEADDAVSRELIRVIRQSGG